MTIKELRKILNETPGTTIKEVIISFAGANGTKSIEFDNLKGFSFECLNFTVLNWEKYNAELLFTEVSKIEFLENLKKFHEQNWIGGKYNE